MMPITYFISDLHLSASRPDITECLARFLRTDALQCEALYVLGDLFEYWLGDDDRTTFNDHIAALFRTVADAGVAIYFIHGNRDFLVRKQFAQRAGMTLLNEREIVDLYGVPTLIMHGDELCTMDIAYQKFRKKARGWWWPRLVLSLPLSTRRKIAENGRKQSQENQKALTMDIMDVTPEEVLKVMADSGVKRLIHGHTHRPAIHDLKVDNVAAQRIVLGDWYDQGSFLKVDAQSFQLITAEFDAPR